jgi:dCMP deaminase
MKNKFKQLYMDWAERLAQMSHAKRLQVGAVIVKDDTVISYGYNGMPAGWENNCEDKEFWNPQFEDLHPDELDAAYPCVANSDEDGAYIGRYRLRTKPEVLHAESNAVAKLAKSVQSGRDAALFVTHAPCMDCAKLIYQSGISNVYYRNSYRDVAGLNFLKQSGVSVEKMEKGQ